jgi:hypothetical protein
MLTTRVEFYCRKCDTPLSKPVRRAEPHELKHGDRESHVPVDAYTVTVDQSGFDIGVYVVHLEAAINGRQHRQSQSIVGCCGPSAEIGDLNWKCKRGHRIGGEQSECWKNHGMMFDPLGVYMVDSNDAELPTQEAFGLRVFAETYPTVLALATGIAAADYLDGLYALADALEEAGYPNGSILEHLRADIVHHEGCIVLDWLLGK